MEENSPTHARGMMVIHDQDWIGKLPDAILENILSRVHTEEAIRTTVLSTRWLDLWKWSPHLALDMRKLVKPTGASVHMAEALTKVIEKHCGHLESCTIHHYICQTEDGSLESLIDTMIRVKHTKALTLVNCGRSSGDIDLHVLPLAFCHHSLTSVSLSGYQVLNGSAFTNCCNLKTLKLLKTVFFRGRGLSRVFEFCPSLEVVVLDIKSRRNRRGVLKIENKNLKFLQVISCQGIDRIEVYAASLAVLDIRFISCEREKFILAAPKVRFNKNYWVHAGVPHPHLSYNISELAQEEKGIWHELMVSEFGEKRRHGSLSLSVDLTNLIEVEILKEVLLMWSTNAMKELEIYFKKNTNAPRQEGEAHKLLSEDENPFPNAEFCVETVWMYNFSGSSEEEFALASHFVKQKTVTKKMMIKTSWLNDQEKLEAESAVAKLNELPKGNQGLSIQWF
ncbi:unnamed protein product [Microthlaspi erraticum]|uniref:F-box domain-containing protein n=1 Tax=Microthlaspi erraticum TaxID=1685480 RepID=A0A6D2K8P9_9BRAS|nr:unnamed protein product [Microthlaspi erraticum]